MRAVRLFDYQQYDGHSWQVAAQDGAELALKTSPRAGFGGPGLVRCWVTTATCPTPPTGCHDWIRRRCWTRWTPRLASEWWSCTATWSRC